MKNGQLSSAPRVSQRETECMCGCEGRRDAISGDGDATRRLAGGNELLLRLNVISYVLYVR